MVKIFAFVALCLSFIAGVWYLANPELWNNRDFIKRSAQEIISSSGTEQVNPDETLANPVTNREVSQQYTCVPLSEELTDPEIRQLYSWRDEKGVLNISDTPPASNAFNAYDFPVSERLTYFNLDIGFRGGSSVPFLQGKLSAHVTGIYEILSGWVGRESLRKVNVDLLIFPDRPQYLQYASSVTGKNMNATDGFYTSGRNEAATYQFADDERTLSVSRHEAVHVIVSGIFGRAPVWLNEGLAEYFEEFYMRDQYKQVNFNAQSFAIALNAINSGYPKSLSDYLLLNDTRWRAGNENVHYALGWSLVYFLNSTEQGRVALSLLLKKLAANYCSSLNSAQFLDQTYPGGMQNLQNQYLAWLRDQKPQNLHRY